MKFITSTDLKQWADTKECQQMLPELIRKLIYATVDTDSIDKSRFPSDDAVFLPGLDGILDCKEKIDQVPAGISLWECGATNDVKRKINDDFNKRNADSLGYDKSKASFVFVTPRLWEGAESWLQTHGEGWKKVIVYTAIELEAWIGQTPSVGMWLAELLKKLPSGGIYTPETYWNRWAQGDNYKLPYDIVLHGRESISHELIETCKSKKSIFLQALTQDECIAFAIATLRTKEIDSIYDRTIIVTKKEAYEDLVEHYDNLILITTLTEGIHYSTRKGHTIVVASTPADQVKNTIILPIIEKQGFIDSLVNMGIDEAKAWNLAKDTTRDINVLRRRIEIIDSKPQWADTIIDLLPAILVGEWHSNCEGDKQILEKLVGSQYEQFEQKLHSFLLKEGAPLLHISDIWRIISPYESIEYILHSNCFTTSILEKFQSICIELIQDDDTEAVGKSKEDGFCFHKNNQKYSNTIKKGVCQTLCLLSVLSESDSGNISQWVEETIRKMLEGWTLTRFLSAQSLLPLLCEVSPSTYLKFVENLPIEMIDEIFKPVKKNYSISNWGINYTELLWSLEMLAWDESFLKRVTQLLLKYSKYENKSNYVNRPENSLDHIYRYYLPQTYVSFENRIAILKSLSSQYRNEVFSLCTSIIKSVEAQVLEPSSHFKWRLFGRLESPKNLYYIALPELKEVVKHMLQCCDYSSGEIVELIKLSFNANMLDVRDMILETIREHLADVNDNQVIADTLRERITNHKQCEGAEWALSEQELVPYQNLLNRIIPKDVLNRNLWLFEDYYAQLPHKRQSDTSKLYEEQENARCQALQDIISDKGENGLWDFIQMVKCPESMANSIITIFEDRLNDDICRKYKSKELSDSFTISYLRTLYRKDSQKYTQWAEQKMNEDNDLLIVLFAPGYDRELADIAEKHSNLIKQSYWSKIQVGFWDRNDTERIVRELISVNRYGMAIEIIGSNIKKIQIPDDEITSILYTYYIKGYFTEQRCDMYQITSILEVLDESDNPTVIQTLILIEFLLYRYLMHRVNISTLRFTKELSRNPELMIQLVELAYRPDDGTDEQYKYDVGENEKTMAKCAWHIFHFGGNIVSFSNKEGEFDGYRMKQYIFELYRLAKEKKRTKIIDFIVGSILGDIPRDNNYPPTELCEIVEELNKDNVDQAIRIRIFNSRGVSTRAYNEGGDQERAIVSKFEKYKEKTKILYPRMTEIFNKLINEYRHDANRIDDEALISDIE